MTPKLRKIRTIRSDMPIRDFYNKRNKVLIIRDGGGVGDILMLRMMLDDFKKIMPDAEIVIATVPNYFSVIRDHPAVSAVVNSRELDENQYLISYNVTSACIRYESQIAPLSDMHRSDIWAAHCGVQLTNHHMHLTVSEENKLFAVKFFSFLGLKTRPIVAFSPFSSMPSKDLDLTQINEVITGIKELGYEIFVLNKNPITGVNCPVAHSISLEQWLACVHQSDYVISVDTGTFHAANGFNKPTVGIFSWADGKIYGKYHQKLVLVQRHREEREWCGPCFNWTQCPKCSEPRKPCITDITGKEICDKFKELLN